LTWKKRCEAGENQEICKHDIASGEKTKAGQVQPSIGDVGCWVLGAVAVFRRAGEEPWTGAAKSGKTKVRRGTIDWNGQH